MSRNGEDMEYKERRKAWLSILSPGDDVAAFYPQRDTILKGKVVRYTRTLFICEIQVEQHSEQIRFVRKTGLQHGGGMVLHVPERDKR